MNTTTPKTPSKNHRHNKTFLHEVTSNSQGTFIHIKAIDCSHTMACLASIEDVKSLTIVSDTLTIIEPSSVRTSSCIFALPFVSTLGSIESIFLNTSIRSIELEL